VFCVLPLRNAFFCVLKAYAISSKMTLNLTQIFRSISRPVDGADHTRRVVFPPKLAEPAFTFIAHMGFSHPNTRTYAELLGQCYKTGRLSPFCQHQEGVSGLTPVSSRRGVVLH